MAVHIALHEVGATFEGRVIKFAHRDQDPPEFRTINPEAKVPTLVIDGQPLTEVAGILYYLAGRYRRRSCFHLAISMPRRRSSPGCRSLPPPYIPPGSMAASMCRKCGV